MLDVMADSRWDAAATCGINSGLTVPCAPTQIRQQVSDNHNDAILSQNSLRYLSEANLPIALT